MIFEGAIATKAILEGKKRNIEYLIIDKTKKDRNTNYIINLANKNNIKIIKDTRENIDKLATGKTHGGILTYATNREYSKINDIKTNNNETIFYIEGIEDPYNLGYALRSLYCFGINNVIINSNHLINSDNIIVKSSAGASEKINIILSNDTKNDINFIKNKGYETILLKRSSDSSIYYNTNYNGKYLVGIGGEKRGVSKDIEQLFDKFIYIPYTNDFRNSLNATSAIVTIASEIQRQKLIKTQ